jgi:hypothetical protein
MKLTNPDARRGIRAIVEAILSLTAIGLVAWLIWLLDGQAEALETIALALIALTALGTCGYVMENVTRAFKFSAGPQGVDMEAGGMQVTADPDAADPKETRPSA